MSVQKEIGFRWLIGLLLVLAWLAALTARSAAPPVPSGKLTAAQEKQLVQLNQELAQAAYTGKMAEALRLAREVAQLRRRWQGASHWQARTADHAIERWVRLARLSDADQKEVARALLRMAEAGVLEARHRYREAEKAYRDVLTILTKTLGEQHPEIAARRNDLAANLNAQGKYREAQPLFEKALEMRTKLLGEEHPDTAVSCNSLAVNLNAQGKYREAQPLYQKALELRKKLLGEQHPDTALSCNNLAGNLHAQGKYREALPLYQKALELRTKLLGEQHSDTAASYNDLAMNLHAQGKYATAQPLFEKALDLYEKVLGEEHPATARSCNNLAFNLNAQGKYREAQPLYEKALEVRKKLLGEQHPLTARSCNNLASNLHAQGKYERARPLFEKALDLYKKVLGEEHPDTVLGYGNLAVNLNAQGKYGEAQPLFLKALQLSSKVLGEEHLETVRICNNLGMNLKGQGKYAEAQPLLQKSLQLHKKLLGEEHPATARGWNNLAMNFDAQGKYAEAQPLLQKSLLLHKKLLGEKHPDTVRSYNNLGINLEAQGKYAEAQALLRKALDLSKKVLGEEHPDTVRGYNNLAANLHAQGKYAEAQPLFQKALDLIEKLLGEQHSHTASSCNNLATNLHAQGKYGEAQPLYRKTLELRKALLGERHPLTAQSCNNLARNLNAQGKYGEAQPLFQKALELGKELLGEQHPQTAQYGNNLADCLYRQGKYREAVRAWQAALLGHDAGRFARASTGFDRALAGATLLTPRQGLVLAHARLKEPTLAWQYAEADLARGLLDDLGGRLDENAALLAQVKTLDERLLPLLSSGKLTEEQKRLREKLTGQRRDLLSRLAKDIADRSAGRVWSLERIRKRMPDDAALVFWVSAGDENWGCVLRPQGEPHWQRLPGPSSKGTWALEDVEQPARLHAALADRNSSPARRRERIEAVRQRWFAPLVQHLRAEGKLPAVRRLFVVPSDFMASLPVEVIAPDWTVSYASSGTLLARTLAGHRPLNASSVLALGDPVFVPAKTPEPPAHGLLVVRVLPGGNAARAGLLGGDVLLRYAGSKLTSIPDLVAAMKKMPKGEAVLWREGKERTVTLSSPFGVQLDNRPGGEAVRAWRTENELVLRSAGYQALPGTRCEVETLQRLLGKRCRTLLGSDASEQRLDELARSGELKRFRVLHLATHGKIDLDRPSLSALILARDRLPSADEQAERASKGLKVYTGELRVGTIYKEWKLDSDLVVLSACETALGRKTNSSGLLGFRLCLASGRRPQRGAVALEGGRHGHGPAHAAFLREPAGSTTGNEGAGSGGGASGGEGLAAQSWDARRRRGWPRRWCRASCRVRGRARLR